MKFIDLCRIVLFCEFHKYIAVFEAKTSSKHAVICMEIKAASDITNVLAKNIEFVCDIIDNCRARTKKTVCGGSNQWILAVILKIFCDLLLKK